VHENLGPTVQFMNGYAVAARIMKDSWNAVVDLLTTLETRKLPSHLGHQGQRN
jgi:hypothetical protein